MMYGNQTVAEAGYLGEPARPPGLRGDLERHMDELDKLVSIAFERAQEICGGASENTSAAGTQIAPAPNGFLEQLDARIASIVNRAQRLNNTLSRV